MNIIGDRHTGINRPSGSQKRKLSKEKHLKMRKYLQRTRHQKVRLLPMDYGRAPEDAHSASERFRIDNFLPIVDQFTTAFTRRI